MTYIPTGTGPDAILCRNLRANLCSKLSFLLGKFMQTREQLLPLDQFRHDEELDDEALEIAGNWRLDSVSSVLTCALVDLQHSLRHLESAHGHVAGIFKGQMRDDTEESLARAIKGAQARLAKMEESKRTYEVPRRPFEIRRNALSCLIVDFNGASEYFKKLIADSSDTGADLIEGLVKADQEFDRLMARVEKLRERSSQKMEQNLCECITSLKSIIALVAEIELEAGFRAGAHYPDYRERLANRKSA